MLLENKNIGFALTGSFCTFEKTIPQIAKLIEEGANVIPIMSFNSYNIDSKFGKAEKFVEQIEVITRKKIIHTIEEAEQIGKKIITDIMIIAPCSRKFYCKNSKWDNRYASSCSCKITFKK